MLHLKKFTINNNKLYNYLIIGKRASGKTSLVIDIFHKLNISNVIVFTDSKENIEQYNKYIEKSCIFTNIDSGVLQNIITNQKNTKKHCDNIIPSEMNICIIIDGYSMKNMCYELRTILCSNRELGITIIMTQQYLYIKDLDTFMCFDYICIFSDNNMYTLSYYYKNFFSKFKSFDKFYNIFKKYTINQQCLVYSNCLIHLDLNIKDLIYWYNAKNIDINLDTIKYNLENDVCSICLDNNNINEYKYCVYCFKCYHNKCYLKLLKMNKLCPLCKTGKLENFVSNTNTNNNEILNIILL